MYCILLVVSDCLMHLQNIDGPSGVRVLHQAAAQIAALGLVEALHQVSICPL